MMAMVMMLVIMMVMMLMMMMIMVIIQNGCVYCSVDDNWSGLTQALSGQFCASLNFIDSKTTTSPKFSFRREGVVSNAAANSSLLRHAALPRELVCTENLTPWKKLLPCDSKVIMLIFVKCGIDVIPMGLVHEYVVPSGAHVGLLQN